MRAGFLFQSSVATAAAAGAATAVKHTKTTIIPVQHTTVSDYSRLLLPLLLVYTSSSPLHE